jgi:5'(3')-deoxyribonucleotidase
MVKVAAIDCDQTVVDSAYPWYEWLELKTKAGYEYRDVCSTYNFSDVYAEIWRDKEISGHPYDFWRGKNIYDNLYPLPGSVEALAALKERGWDIVFVSTIKGDHHKSKYNFLKKHFPFMDGFIATKEKGYVNARLVIDDRNSCLNLFGEDVIKIKKVTPFDQDVALNGDGAFASFNYWSTFKAYIKNGTFDF